MEEVRLSHKWRDEMTCEAVEDLGWWKLPPGFKFLPTDVELVTECLRPKVEDSPPPLAFMKEVKQSQSSCSPYDHVLQAIFYI